MTHPVSSSIRRNNSEQWKTITISANVADEKEVRPPRRPRIAVKKKAAITAKRLPDIVFPVGGDARKCGKAASSRRAESNIDNDPTATFFFVGHQTENEASGPGWIRNGR